MEVALVMEEEEEDMVVEDLDMATRVGATEVVMTTMEEVINSPATFMWEYGLELMTLTHEILHFNVVSSCLKNCRVVDRYLAFMLMIVFVGDLS